MTSRTASRLALLFSVFALCLAPSPALADHSQARIVRLSLVQGDVRISHDVKGDPLTSSDTVWESAGLNLPIRQGYVLATDQGRAEVEFENGAMAYLAENTVLEFYDLSLEDGAHITRLILRQGSAEFYVNSGRGDYFSVTGGDFSIEASEKATFRLNNYDDGSDVQVTRGHVSVLNKDKTTQLSKGQSLSINASDPGSLSVERLADTDEFDQWVSGRIESVVSATTAGQQYSNSFNYLSGFGDLYTYGSWFSVAGYGNCWRPYGVSSGWAPFNYGHWIYDPFFGGWTFVGSQPWGWLPYHYGGWIFQPGFGWVWSPGGSFGGGGGRPHTWRPVTAAWVHSGNTVGIVPTHPLDARGKTPINIREGIFPVTSRGISERVPVTTAENWKNLKNPPREALHTEVALTTPPTRVTRTLASAGSPGRSIAMENQSGIAYDPAQRRFVNNNSAAVSERVATSSGAGNSPRSATPPQGTSVGSAAGQNSVPTTGRAATPRSDRVLAPRDGREAVTPPARSAMPPAPRSSAAPPPAPRGGSSNAASSSGSRMGGTPSSSSGSSARPSSSSSSSSSSRPASSSGGRPH